ncbi:MAG: hypothetical protein XD91_1577 [Clostridiales bacterium 38_11]|nr:MAG: hypothetical protein XD91_1577 [Clostridiales bacterium 38_11]
MAKAPKLPSYEEAVKASKKKVEPKKEKLFTKDEEEKIDDLLRRSESDKNRERGITIAFRVSCDERDRIYKRIALSGKKVREFMRDAVLNAPIKAVATRKVVLECKSELERIAEELERLNQNESIPERTLYNLDLVLNILSGATEHT